MASPAKPALRSSTQLEPPRPTEEEIFEDVGLNDEPKQPPKKRGIFARFGDNAETAASVESSRPNSSHRGFHLPGRKRAQSGQGAELGQMTKPANSEGANGVTAAASNGILHGISYGEQNGDNHDVAR